jgi:hypothetical protein
MELVSFLFYSNAHLKSIFAARFKDAVSPVSVAADLTDIENRPVRFIDKSWSDLLLCVYYAK